MLIKHLLGPLEYACAVWNPYTVHDIALLESVQNRAAHWIKSSWDSSTFKWSKSSSISTEELRWPSLKVHGNNISVLTLYSILHGTTSINFSHYFQLNTLATCHMSFFLKFSTG